MAARLLRLAALVLVVPFAGLLPAAAQSPSPRFWLAGRYDGNHVIVFFDAVKFKGTVPRTARSLAVPTTPGFLFQKELPASYIAQFTRKAGTEQFHTGDQYDLLLGDGRITTVTLTTVVAYISDDEDDDPSYVGALAKVYDATALVGPQGYYVLQRHDPGTAGRKAQPSSASATLLTASGSFASLFEEPVRFDLQMQIATLLTERVGAAATAEEQEQIRNLAPTLAVDAFRLADGELRYYARAEWRAEDRHGGPPILAIGAWIGPQPELKILALERITSPYGFLDELPQLLNVIDLGGGRTGIIANISEPGDSRLALWEYHDGADLGHMRIFQSLVTDE